MSGFLKIILCGAFFLSTCVSSTLAQLTVYNKGIGGQNSGQGRARFEKDVIALKPDYVFIYFGLNDTLNEPAFLPLEKFVANLEWMAGRTLESGINPVLCTIHRVSEEPLYKRHKRDSYGAEGPNGKVGRYNIAIRQLAKEKNIKLADFACVVEKAPEYSKIVSSDGVHLTPAGYELLAKTFFGVINKELKGSAKIVCIGDSVTFGAGAKGAGTIEGETYPAFLKQLK